MEEGSEGDHGDVLGGCDRGAKDGASAHRTTRGNGGNAHEAGCNGPARNAGRREADCTKSSTSHEHNSNTEKCHVVTCLLVYLLLV